jgi:hypothetical protein
MNTSGINRLAIMPFTSMQGGSANQVAGALTGKAVEVIQSTGKFTLVDAAEVKRRQNAKENLANFVDGLFTGEVTNIESKDTSEYHPATKYSEAYTSYNREVTLNFTYRLVRTRDGSLAGQISKTGRTSDYSSEARSNLDSVFVLAQRIINWELRYLNRDVAPWSIEEKRVLMDETSKNKELKQRMKDAQSLVKEGSYKSAFNAYARIYEDTESLAAGYNTAIMTEILGDLPGAIERMRLLEEATANPKVAAELVRMRQTLAEGQALDEKFSNTSGLADLAIKQAASEIMEQLQPDAKISLLNISAIEPELMEYVLDGIVRALINSGSVTVVDRQNQALIEAEQQFQLSGAVSDDSAVSIGNQLGVGTIITCSIAGANNLRRLIIRILSVETGEIVYQGSLEI